jgi:hypothetical protein
MLKKFVFGALVVALVSAGAANAQGIKRTPWQKVEFPDGYDTITAIDSYQIPLGAVHDARTSDHKPLKVLGIDIITKGQPLRHVGVQLRAKTAAHRDNPRTP